MATEVNRLYQTTPARKEFGRTARSSQFLYLLHQLELLVFQFPNLIFVALDFVTHRLELVVLAGLILLGLEARDALVARADVELQLFAVDFHLPGFLLSRLEAGSAFGQLRFKMLS